MSRTTRSNSDDKRAGHYYKESGDLNKYINHRDHKEGEKPPSWFKRIRSRLRRHRIKQAMRDGKETLPKFKKDDAWNWT